MIKLTIPGEPVGKARARQGKWGTYTPEKTVNYETLVKELFVINYPAHKLWEEKVYMEVEAHYSIPKSATKKKKELMRKGEMRPLKKPDLSNILKIIEDALNQMAYKDDSQIVDAKITKHYTDQAPCVKVKITAEEGE